MKSWKIWLRCGLSGIELCVDNTIELSFWRDAFGAIEGSMREAASKICPSFPGGENFRAVLGIYV